MLRQGRRMLPIVLIVLFCMNAIWFGTGWQRVRDIFIGHNSSQQTMYAQFLQQTAPRVQDIALIITVLIADALLV